MTVLAGNLRLGAHGTRRLYLGSALVFAAEQTRWENDFRAYAAGSAPDDWSFHPEGSGFTTWQVMTGGLVSDKFLRFTMTNNTNTRRGAVALWDAVPPAVDSEVLMLMGRNWVQTRSGIAQRMRAKSWATANGYNMCYNDHALGGLLARTIINGDHNTVHNYNQQTAPFPNDTAYWLRSRWEGNTYRLKGWAATDAADRGLSDEPGEWQFVDTMAFFSAPGQVGFAYAGRQSANGIMDLHYIGVGIDGDRAPAPAFGPVSPPSVPDPGPGPDPIPPGPIPGPGTFQTFDSTATSFDCSTHTFDEVA